MIKLSPEEERRRIAWRMQTSNIFRRNGILLSLLAGYQLYLNYEECKRAMSLNISYQEAERIMSVIEEYIPLHISPELVVKSEDQRANELLDARTALDDFLQKRFHESFRPMVMGFFHQLRHRMKMDQIWASSLQVSLSAFHNYAIGMIDREIFNETNYGNGTHIWFEPVTKQRRAGCKAAGVDFLPGAGDTDDQGVALAVILAHCKPVLENFYFPDNLEKFYSEDGSKAAELADLFLTTCDIDSDVTDEAFFTTDNTTADTETGEQNTDRSCKNRFTYEMLANVYDLPL